MSDRIIKAQGTGQDKDDDAPAESSEMTNHPDMELDQDMDANYCFADIYLRNAPPAILKAFLVLCRNQFMVNCAMQTRVFWPLRTGFVKSLLAHLS